MKAKLFKLQFHTGMGWCDLKMQVDGAWRPWLIAGEREAYRERDWWALKHREENYRVVLAKVEEDVDVYVEPVEAPAT
jgi:hypothetical protein